MSKIWCSAWTPGEELCDRFAHPARTTITVDRDLAEIERQEAYLEEDQQSDMYCYSHHSDSANEMSEEGWQDAYLEAIEDHGWYYCHLCGDPYEFVENFTDHLNNVLNCAREYVNANDYDDYVELCEDAQIEPRWDRTDLRPGATPRDRITIRVRNTPTARSTWTVRT